MFFWLKKSFPDFLLLVGYSTGFVIERLRVRSPAGAAGEFSSPELTLFADSTQWQVKDPGHSAKSTGGR